MICKYLDLSTRHLSEEGRNILDDGGVVGGDLVLSVDLHSYGWWLSAGTEPALLQGSAIPADLLSVMKFAKDAGAEWIRFDCDGDEIEELPSFEWSDGSASDNVTVQEAT